MDGTGVRFNCEAGWPPIRPRWPPGWRDWPGWTAAGSGYGCSPAACRSSIGCSCARWPRGSAPPLSAPDLGSTPYRRVRLRARGRTPGRADDREARRRSRGRRRDGAVLSAPGGCWRGRNARGQGSVSTPRTTGSGWPSSGGPGNSVHPGGDRRPAGIPGRPGGPTTSSGPPRRSSRRSAGGSGSLPSFSAGFDGCSGLRARWTSTIAAPCTWGTRHCWRTAWIPFLRPSWKEPCGERQDRDRRDLRGRRARRPRPVIVEYSAQGAARAGWSARC